MSLLSVAQLILGIILFVVVFNTAWVVYLAVVLCRPRRPPRSNSLEKTAVFLCLRGADPKLSDCLDRLMAQDHPNFEVMVVVDSVNDPAWPVAQAAVERYGYDRLRVWPLENRRKTCGLKNSSLVQLLDRLDPSHQVIAFADADLESHRTWLRELVTPLSDPGVGLTFGNRWFLPSVLNTGSLVRQIWNSPGLIVMSAFKIPWAGSLSIRRSIVESGNVREKLATSIVDDGPLRLATKQLGLRSVFVPSLIMPNREVCDLRFTYTFIRRQLTWTRTYFMDLWLPMVGYHLLAMTSSVAANAVAVIGWYRGDQLVTGLGLFGFCVSMGASVLHHLLIDGLARRVVRSQGASAPSLRPGQWMRLVLNFSLAAGIGLIASFAATFSRRIVWRGVTYEIRGPWDIRLIDDNKPTVVATQSGDTQRIHPSADVSL